MICAKWKPDGHCPYGSRITSLDVALLVIVSLQVTAMAYLQHLRWRLLRLPHPFLYHHRTGPRPTHQRHARSRCSC